VIAAALGGSCIAPLPPPSRTALLDSRPGPTADAGPTGSNPAEASPPIGGEASATIRVRVPVTAEAVAADGDEAWYVREDPPVGRLGHVPATGGRPLEVDAGPTPVDLAVGPEALYVLEGIPDDDPRKGLPRVGVLEKVDRSTLRVLATTKLTGLPVDVLLDGDRVWVGGVQGAIAAFDAGTLAPLASTGVSGRGSSILAAGGGAVWMVNGVVGRHVQFVHRIDPVTATEISTWAMPGDGVFAAIAVGSRVWVAAPDQADSLLYPISLNGAIALPLRVPRIATLGTESGSLWWLSTGAVVNRLDETTLVRSAPVDLGDVGQGFAVSGDRVWAASEDLVELTAPG